MAHHEFDLVIIGAGSGGLTAAAFAARIGARVALVEKNRIGGDCTWTGCVPSKALLKAAKVAHGARRAGDYGIRAEEVGADMARVRDYVRGAIAEVYRRESPEELRGQGIEVIEGAARFLDSRSIAAGGATIRSRNFLLATGARPYVPPVSGLADVPFVTYEQIFENGRLPAAMTVIGAGPIGMEIAQAYQRLGARVTVVAGRILPKEEPEAGELMRRVLEGEGARFVTGRADSAWREGDQTVVSAGGREIRSELLLVAAGRRPVVEGLDLERAGVNYSEWGIPVDGRLRTNVGHIYAAGDVAGGPQFTHLAGWQAFQAARNALLPGSASGAAAVVPRVTFTDPEVAQVGATEDEARAGSGGVQAIRWDLGRADRAVCENDRHGFLKLIAARDGTLLGATMVAARAGEAIAELVLAIGRRMNTAELAAAIHPYPTYSTLIQQLCAEAAVEKLFTGFSGAVLRGLTGFGRPEERKE